MPRDRSSTQPSPSRSLTSHRSDQGDSLDPSKETHSGHSKKTVLLFGVFLALSTAALFGKSLGYGFVLLDDYSKVIENPNVVSYLQSPAKDRLLTPGQGYVIPVTVATWAAIYAAGKENPRPFRTVNLIIHVTVVLLLYGFLLRFSLPIAFLGAGLLALHPIVVEPVAWITGLKDLLAAVFAIGGIRLFITGVERCESAEESGRTLVLAAALLFLLSSLSKPTTVLLPSAMMVWLFAKKQKNGKYIPEAWWTAGAIQAICLLFALISWAGHETLIVDSSGPTTFGDGSALYVLGLQAKNLVWPTDLHPLYFVADGPAWSHPYTWLGIAVFIGLCFAFYRARRQPYVLLGLSVMVACYLPVSNIITTPRRIADSYLYLPLAGGMIALASSLTRINIARFRFAIKIPAFAKTLAPPFIVLIILVGAAGISVSQTRRWSGGKAFWGPIIQRWPHWDRGYYGLASVRLRQVRDKEAADLYRQGYSRGYRREHLADYGVALAASGQFDAGECVLIEAIHHGTRPEEALRNYGRLLGNRPNRAPRYPVMATHLVPAAMVALSEHSKNKSMRAIKGLDYIRRRLGPPTLKPPAWPQPNCPELSTCSRISTNKRELPPRPVQNSKIYEHNPHGSKSILPAKAALFAACVAILRPAHITKWNRELHELSTIKSMNFFYSWVYDLGKNKGSP